MREGGRHRRGGGGGGGAGHAQTWSGSEEEGNSVEIELQFLGQHMLHRCPDQAGLLTLCRSCSSSCLLRTQPCCAFACTTTALPWHHHGVLVSAGLALVCELLGLCFSANCCPDTAQSLVSYFCSCPKSILLPMLLCSQHLCLMPIRLSHAVGLADAASSKTVN